MGYNKWEVFDKEYIKCILYKQMKMIFNAYGKYTKINVNYFR